MEQRSGGDLGLIGVAPHTEIPNLKHHALTFNAVYLRNFRRGAFGSSLRFGDQAASEVEWLAEQGVILTEESRLIPKRFTNEESQKMGEAFRNHPVPLSGNLVRGMMHTVDAEVKAGVSVERARQAFWAEEDDAAIAQVRLASAILRAFSVSAVPVIPAAMCDNVGTEPSDVVQVVIDNLPVPDESTSWEQIIEFRGDERIAEHHRDLRMWIARAASGLITARELAGEIESSTESYRRYMREHRAGITMGRMEALIRAAAVGYVAGMGVDEKAALAGAIGSIYATLRRERAELMKEEMTAPGAELAYIVKARERFGR